MNLSAEEALPVTSSGFLNYLRTLLILGRVSNLPTVWSNLIVGWLLVGKRDNEHLTAQLLLGGSLLYIGGMYLNDFCDAAFDTAHCSQRPIPAGKISRTMVGLLAVLWFALALACLVPFGTATTIMTFLLLGAIALYDFHHKDVVWAPLLMGVCRFLLYFLASSTVNADIFQPVVLQAAAPLALYVAGITYLARGESRPQKPVRWALILLLLPVLVSFLFCYHNLVLGVYSLILFWWVPHGVVWFWAIFLAWLLWLLVPFWRKTKPSLGRVVSGLLAGIVLVDLIAITPFQAGEGGAILFIPLFLLSLVLQRFIPAT